MRRVAIVGTGQVAVRKKYDLGLRELGASVIEQALGETNKSRVEALYLGNMLSDELQAQKHLAALVADEARLAGVEAIQVRAATASGAAALRVAHLAVAGGAVDLAVAVGVEKMSDQVPTAALAKALDARSEVPDGKTLLSQNALLMQLYLQEYGLPPDALASFSVNAHRNAQHNPYAMFRDRQFTAAQVAQSRLIYPPLRLLDCSPVSDGAAAVLLAPLSDAQQYTSDPVQIIASSATTDRFRMADRANPLRLEAASCFGTAGLAPGGSQTAGCELFRAARCL